MAYQNIDIYTNRSTHNKIRKENSALFHEILTVYNDFNILSSKSYINAAKGKTIFSRHLHTIVFIEEKTITVTNLGSCGDQRATNLVTYINPIGSTEPWYCRNEMPNKIMVFLPLNTSEESIFVSKSRTYTSFINMENILTNKMWSTRSKNNRRVTRYNQFYEQSSLEFSRLHLFIQVMYQIIQHLMKYGHYGQAREGLSEGTSVTLTIELEKLQTHFNPKTESTNIEDNIQTYKTKKLVLTRDSKRQSIKSYGVLTKLIITFEHRCLHLKSSLCKYQSKSHEFMRTLANVYSLLSMSFTNYWVKNWPSLCTRKWYFSNITQGYLLRILLKTANIGYLNGTRKLNYVIITSSTPNVNIEINFKLWNGIFMIFDSNQLCGFPQYANNDIHHLTINNPLFMDTVSNVIQCSFKSHEKTLEAITCKKIPFVNVDMFKSVVATASITSNIDEKAIVDCSSFLDSRSLTEIYYTESSTVVTEKDSCRTFMISLGDVLNQYKPEDSGTWNTCTIINNIIQVNRNIYNINFLHSKRWLTQLFRKPKKTYTFATRSLVNFIYFQIFNENIFERFSLEKWSQSISSLYFQHICSQKFCKIFFTSLAYALVNTMFSAVI